MGNLTVPTSVAVAGGVLCVLGGYLVGSATGPEPSAPLTAEVASYDRGTDRLCLTGSAVEDLPQAEEGRLCGTWRRTAGSRTPRPGDSFRFVTMANSGEDSSRQVLFLYGEPVR